MFVSILQITRLCSGALRRGGASPSTRATWGQVSSGTMGRPLPGRAGPLPLTVWASRRGSSAPWTALSQGWRRKLATCAHFGTGTCALASWTVFHWEGPRCRGALCVSPWDPGGCGYGAFSCGHWWADVSVPSSAPAPGHVPRCPPAHSPLTPADRLGSGVRPPPPGLGVSPTDLGETPSSACLPSCWGREYLLSCQGRGQAPPSLRVPAFIYPCRLSVRTSSYLSTWNVPAPHTLLPHLPSPPAGTHCLPPGLCLGGCYCLQWMWQAK